MKQAKRIWMSNVAVPVLALAISGCASYKINSTLAPTHNPVPTATTFTLADVTYVTNTVQSGLNPFGYYDIVKSASLKADLMAMAMAEYPKTFSTASDAVPLKVTITCTGNETTMNEGATCVSCVTLTIIPLMSTDSDTYVVQTTSGNAALDKQLARPVEFKRTDTSWMSILPTGWIPVPAGSSGERAWGTDSAIAKVKEATLKGCVEAIVTNLRQIKPAP